MIKVITGDITKLDVDAIVNAANRTLLGGGGVDGAIHRAAGPQLLEECYTLHGCETGEAKITKGYNLPAQYVIHTVGPIWQGGGADEEVQLAACYWNSLRLAADNGCRSIAFPAISTGVYGYPKEAAAKTAVAAIEAFLRRRERENEGGDMLVILCAFSAGDAKIYEQILAASPEEASEAEESPKTGADYIHSLEGAVSEEVLQDVAAFLNARMEEEETFGSVPDEAAAPILRVGKANVPAAAVPQMYGSVTAEMSVEPEAICDSAMPDFPDLEMPFRDKLFELIDARGLSDPEVYKRANIDRKLFSKIRNSEAYTPKKKTALALAVALELTPEETEDLLCRAGYALSPSSRFDMIIRYFLEKGEYDIFMINATLYAYDEPLLGL